MKRLGIFVFYDSKGVVGKYVEYLLTEIKSVTEDLYIVSNCTLTDRSRQIFSKYTKNILERENNGFDAEAYKEVLCNVIGLSNCKRWDELLLVNDTFYGPFCSLSSIFDKMDQSCCDFWGLSIHGDRKVDIQNIIRKHVQSYFLVIRSKMLRSRYFVKFWMEMQEIDSYEAAVNHFEIAFTQFFSKRGFAYDVLVDTAFLDVMYSENSTDFVALFPYQMISEIGFPIVKRKALVKNNILSGESLKILEYIKNNTHYDIQMIWEDLLRKYDIHYLIYAMNLLYVVDEKKHAYIERDHMKAAVVFRIHQISIFERIVSYLNKIGHAADLYAWIEDSVLPISIKEQCDFVKIADCKNQDESRRFWKDISERYRTVGYIDLEIMLKDDYYLFCMSKDAIWGNLLNNEQYIYQICNLMAEEKELGMLIPPTDGNGNQKDVWGEKAFWMKGKCLNDLCQNQMAVKTQWLPEIVREQGYYSAIVESDAYSKTEVKRWHQKIYENELKSFFCRSENNFYKFWNSYEKRYIFGTGKIAEKFTKYLFQMNWNIFEGYITSEKQRGDQLFYGKRVWQIDEIEGEGVGIVIAMSDKNTREVLPILNAKQGIHYFILSGMEVWA